MGRNDQFLRGRHDRIKNIVTILKKNKHYVANSLIAKCCLDTGCKKETVEGYLRLLVDGGEVYYKDGEFVWVGE